MYAPQNYYSYPLSPILYVAQRLILFLNFFITDCGKQEKDRVSSGLGVSNGPEASIFKVIIKWKNMYCMHAIITSLYILKPLFEGQKILKGFFIRLWPYIIWLVPS